MMDEYFRATRIAMDAAPRTIVQNLAFYGISITCNRTYLFACAVSKLIDRVEEHTI